MDLVGTRYEIDPLDFIGLQGILFLVLYCGYLRARLASEIP
jgi:hypothetical protein